MTLHSPDFEVLATKASPSGVRIGAAGHGEFYRHFAKRGLDLLLIVLALPVVLPLMAVLTVLAALDGGSPFYLQQRLGRDGKIFNMVKFRTMVPNAKQALESHLAGDPAARLEWDISQKLKNDPRITYFGRFMRRTSLDELPQLLNVLTGSMSLVGPRPMMVEQASSYPGSAYYKMRPGITGSWQVSERNDCGFAARAQFDESYFDEVSFSTDARILAQTVTVVFRCTGY